MIYEQYILNFNKMQVEILQFKKLLKIIYKNRTSNISNIYISIRIDIFHCNRYNFM